MHVIRPYSLSQDIYAYLLKKNTYTCEKSAIEIDGRENFQYIFIDT